MSYYFMIAIVYTGSMKVIVGLGNPGQQYVGTRHNVGFAVLDSYARLQGWEFVNKTKFGAAVAEGMRGETKIMLIKPQKFYNLSGEVVRAITHYYNVAIEDILIVHDELALAAGTVRTRIGGSDAGNNGVKSISTHVGEHTARVRIGIRGERATVIDDASYVLSRFTEVESTQFADSLPTIHAHLDAFIEGTFTVTTHKRLTE